MDDGVKVVVRCEEILNESLTNVKLIRNNSHLTGALSYADKINLSILQLLLMFKAIWEY